MFAICSLLVALSSSQAPPAADQTGRISGRVTLEGANTPISGARITLIPTARPTERPTEPIGPPPQTTTDQDGRFGFDRVRPGAYRLDAQKTGLAPADASRAPTVTIAAGQSIDNVNLRLQKGAAITGRVLDPAGEPMPDARVMALRRPPANAAGMSGSPRLIPAPNGGTQTNDIGEFRLSGLPPGEYVVAAMPRPAMIFGTAGSDSARDRRAVQTTLPTTYYPGTTDQAAAQPIAVAAGADAGNIFITMRPVPAFRVSGIVMDEEGKPIAGAMVMLMSDPRNGSFGPVGNARSRDDGRFDVDGVPAGTYRANASIMVTMSGGSGGARVVDGVSGVVVGSGGSWSSFSIGAKGTPAAPPAEVVVIDADVSEVRVVAQRPTPR